MTSYTDYNYVSLFNPEGKVKPIENIIKSVELGTNAIAITSGDAGIILAHSPSTSTAFPQNKIFRISPKTLFTFSGITNDGLFMVDYLINKTINEHVYKNRNINTRVFDDLSHTASLRTMYYSNRPLGVGGLLLVAGENIELLEFMPTGIVNVCYAMSIGSRAQSARTILEREYKEGMSIEDMVRVGIKAMKNAVSELKKEDIMIWGVGKENDAYEISADGYF